MNIEAAMLQPGRQTQTNISVLPVAEMPLILTLDQLTAYQHNPRTSRNPRYDEIKASIRARGLDTVLVVTRDPDTQQGCYTFSDGGNTRYQILSELWQETGDERFYRFHVLFKPWPGHLQCLVGHLAKDEARGELSFIEKAQGIHKARQFHEDNLQHAISIRELAALLTNDGLPISHSSISRMEHALKYLYPSMPKLLESGLGRPQITALLALRQEAEKVWEKFSMLPSSGGKYFAEVFGECCRRFDSPDLWSLEIFRDEFIGDLLQALPHPELDYDRWMLELDPKERNRQRHFGEPAPVIQNPQSETHIPPAPSVSLADAPAGLVRDTSDKPSPRKERNNVHDFSRGTSSEISLSNEANTDEDDDQLPLIFPVPESMDDGTHQNADDPTWHIPSHQNDIEHLQNMAFRLAWELGEVLGCEDEILPDRENDFSPGYRSAGENLSNPACFLLSLTGLTPAQPQCGLYELFIGGTEVHGNPALRDEDALKMLSLFRVLRRLRELQRGISSDEESTDE